MSDIIEHQHKENEDCMNCQTCGKCREDLDENDICPDCGGDVPWFLNYYRCDNGHEWTDEWPAMCDDDCPTCGQRHISPYKSEDAAPRPEPN